MNPPKPSFEPLIYFPRHEEPVSSCSVPPLRFKDSAEEWVCIASVQVEFSVHEFSQVADALVHHPERNSPLILRAEITSNLQIIHPKSPISSSSPELLLEYHPTRRVRRVLCPRQPKRDRALHQSCTFYAPEGKETPTVLVLSPDLSEEHPVPPFYHPAVRHLAIRYIEAEAGGGQIVVDAVRLVPHDELPSRLVKTCVSLLEGVHRVGYGYANGYRKRVEHDTLVDKAEFQDLYLQMKEMYGGMAENWQEATDPSKHVFEDIGIATFLIILWKNTYQGHPPESTSMSDAFPWSRYPRPPGGFRDIGCGNGLLTHILVASGYKGIGIDLRERKSWSNYPAETQACLKVAALDFTALKYNPLCGNFEGLPDVLLPEADEKVFLIGNHADELTPWMPLVAHASRADFINIPCCFWGLDERFQARKTKDMPGPSTSAQPCPEQPWELALADRLHSVIGGQSNVTSPTKKTGTKQPSQYGRYMLWVARLQWECGFEVEVEALRIPSTRNWAFVGRARSWEADDERSKYDEYVDDLVGQVRQRGLFKTRVPEGKEGGFITIY